MIITWGCSILQTFQRIVLSEINLLRAWRQWRSRGCWGSYRTTLLLGPPMVNRVQDPDTKTHTNVVGCFIIMGIILFLHYFFYFKGLLGPLGRAFPHPACSDTAWRSSCKNFVKVLAHGVAPPESTKIFERWFLIYYFSFTPTVGSLEVMT